MELTHIKITILIGGDGKMGVLINTITNSEVMYLHFINWKNKIIKNEVIYANSLDSFIISYNGIHIKENNRIKIIFNLN